MEVRNSEKVREETEGRSSHILDLTGLRGKVTEARASTIRCSDYAPEEEVYRARHSWSLYDVPVEDLEKGMDRLRKQLPENGWRIVKDGTDSSRARSPQLVADSADEKFSVDVRLLDLRKYEGKTPLLEVTVVSACYRSGQEPADGPT